MAVFKCECCGGNLDVINNKGSRIIQCPYCETQQTTPQTEDEKKVNLYNRAVKLRRECEFDRAEGVYESIVASSPDDAEAYWGLCLCKYGIEYVDDPATGKKIPTCHRTVEESILYDTDFEQVLENSDTDMIKMYRSKAKEIDRIQQSILEVAAKENPYDIFICYKETDESGQRTDDSVYAQDIYNSLTAKGFKVFFAKITLEDKLGQAYEPYIFSALRSSKIMLVVCTSYEHINAVWVKNEWQRFLQLRKKDTEKVLIPCYRDMDAYDLPKEFKNLQAVNLATVGYLQDLVRNVSKIIAPEPQTTVVFGGANIESLMIRAEDYLADKNWVEAENYSEKVLDINPRYAKAYLTNLMAQLHISKIDDIDTYSLDIRDNPNYRKFTEYADDKLKQELKPHFEKAEIFRKDSIYARAMQLANSDYMVNVTAAIDHFSKIKDWKDADEQILNCRRKITNYEFEEANKELKEAKARLNRSRSISRIFASVFCMAAIIIGAMMAFISGNFGNFANEHIILAMLLGGYFIAGIGVIVSTMRLFHSYSIGGFIGSFFVNCVTVYIVGIVASIINLVRDKISQHREIKENRSVVNDINKKIENLKSVMNNIK